MQFLVVAAMSCGIPFFEAVQTPEWALEALAAWTAPGAYQARSESG